MECSIDCVERYNACNPQPNALIMFFRIAALGSGIMTGLGGIIREKKYKHLAVWLGGYGLFLTLCRYLICSRCEGYGQKCYSYYGGRYTSLIFPYVEGKEPGPLGIGLEVLGLATTGLVPAFALRDNRKLLKRYLAIMQLVMTMQFIHGCRWCAANSTQEWKNACLFFRIWKKIQE